MAPSIPSIKRGRPPRHPVDVLRTQLWFHVVKLRSGLSSAYTVEKALEPDLVRIASDGVVRPRKWDSYERGSRVPLRKVGSGDAVELAERHVPGTAAWFDNPLWGLLKRDNSDGWGLQTQLGMLSQPVKGLLLREDTSIAGRFELAHLTPDHFSELVALASFDALAAVGILARLSEKTASHELRELVIEAYLQLQPVLADTPELSVHYPDVYTYMDRLCKPWIVISPGRRMTAHMFWQSLPWAKGRQKQFEERLKQIYLSNHWDFSQAVFSDE